MKFGKLTVNQTLITAPKAISHSGILYTGDIPENVYITAGYFPVEDLPPPQIDPRYQTVEWKYEVNKGIIKRTWKTRERNIDEVKEEKLTEINTACNQIIAAGVDVETSQGIEHFSLTANDQINIAFYEQQISAGASHIPYHADGKLCRMFAAAEITAVATAAAQWKVYHTTYCNHLRDHIKGLDVAEDIAAVTYGMELPEELKASFDAIIAALGGAGDETPD